LCPDPTTVFPEPPRQTLVTRSVKAIGTTALVAVQDSSDADLALEILSSELEAIDRTCSRFRPDSEIARLNEARGSSIAVSPLLFEALTVAVDVALRTHGAVDPTVGAALEALGYDRDFEEVTRDERPLRVAPRPAPGWQTIELDASRRTVRVPGGVHLDLGATAKALVTDRAAEAAAREVQRGVLVSIGGDVAVAGPPPDGGWSVGIARDSSIPTDRVDQVVAISSGGLASSSTAVRQWRRGEQRLHHIVDPSTGSSVDPVWVLVSATGTSCVDANAASTAALVWGGRALEELRGMGQPARLVARSGRVVTLNGWPEDQHPT
jgi:FAD:protein FMN transferase